MTDVDISIEICGVTFKNPIIIASGTPTKDAKYMLKAIKSGAGGIVSKSVTTNPLLQKYVRPRFTILHKKGWPYCFSNYSCEFLATFSPKSWMKEMREARRYCDKYDTILIGSVGGGSFEEWINLSKELVEAGADILELNFGCPHPRGQKLGYELGRDPELGAEIVRAIKKELSIPVFVKLTAEGTDIVEVAKKIVSAGADGITAVNRFQALDIDINTGRPLLHGTFAGIGGPWMLPITLKWIAKLAMELKHIPISATNGVWIWEDVVKCIMVGASTVQTCTAILYGTKGYSIVREFINRLVSFMESNGYKKIEDFKGITLKQIKSFDKLDRETKLWSVVNEERCNGCKLCLNWCFYDAINMKDNKAYINKNMCDGCGLCVSLCPQNAIYMVGGKVFM